LTSTSQVMPISDLMRWRTAAAALRRASALAIPAPAST
jgi:hypothetical protein